MKAYVLKQCLKIKTLTGINYIEQYTSTFKASSQLELEEVVEAFINEYFGTGKHHFILYKPRSKKGITILIEEGQYYSTMNFKSWFI